LAASQFRHGNAIFRNNLRLIGEHFPALRFHQNLEPVIAVDSVFLMIAEGFYTSERFNSGSANTRVQ